MSYAAFLIVFLVLPIALLTALAVRDARRGLRLPPGLRGGSPAVAIGVHVLLAVVYTTPWDNHLVATGVWWYDPEKVLGLVLGVVPIEEYTFFVLQPILVGLWLLAAARRLPGPGEGVGEGARLRVGTVAGVGVVWLWSVWVLVTGWAPGRYLGLTLAWGLVPLAIQLAFGADLLWRRRRLLAAALLPPWLYLCAADALAIGSGTWTIDPAQSTGILLLGVLPLEEAVFFGLTCVLVAYGTTLMLCEASRERLAALRAGKGAPASDAGSHSVDPA